jgi:hypothetical protein
VVANVSEEVIASIFRVQMNMQAILNYQVTKCALETELLLEDGS